MNIYDALMDDHQEIKNLFDEIEQPPHLNGKSRSTLFAKVKTLLQVHGEAEEQIFYTKLRRHGSTCAKIEQSVEDHDHMIRTLEDLESMDMGSSTWLNKMMSLHDEIQHHIQEEEGAIFPEARKIISDQEAEDMAQQYKKAKTEIPMSLSC